MQITQELKQVCSLLRNRVPAIFSMQMAHFHAGCHQPSGWFSCLADICAVYRHSPPPSPAHLYKDQPILSLRAGNPPRLFSSRATYPREASCARCRWGQPTSPYSPRAPTARSKGSKWGPNRMARRKQWSSGPVDFRKQVLRCHPQRARCRVVFLKIRLKFLY